MDGKSVLQLHRRRDGSIVAVGDLPDRHVFSARYIANLGRGLDDAGEPEGEPMFTKAENGMDITFEMVDGPVIYAFVGFDKNDDGSLNMGALVYERQASSAKNRRGERG